MIKKYLGIDRYLQDPRFDSSIINNLINKNTLREYEMIEYLIQNGLKNIPEYLITAASKSHNIIKLLIQ